MEKDDFCLSPELEQMKNEYEVLKEKLSKQLIVNDKLLKESMKTKLTWLDKEERDEYVTGAVAILLSPCFRLTFGASWWLIGFTVLMVAFCLFANWWIHRKVGVKHLEAQDMHTVLCNVRKLRQCYADWLKWSIPLIVVWFSWLVAECYLHADDKRYAIGLCISGFVGGCVGGAIGLRIRRKSIRTCDALIEQLEN